MKTIAAILSPVLLAAFVISGCASATAPVTPEPAAPTTGSGNPSAGDIGSAGSAGSASSGTGGGFEISMHRSVCFGRCPSYSVRISGEGAVEFSGEHFVSAIGAQQGRADPERLKRLRSLLNDSETAALDSDYTPANAKACGIWATDSPSVTIDIRNGPFPRQIKHYLGCEGAPKQLRTLEQAIDDAAGTSRWTGAASSQ